MSLSTPQRSTTILALPLVCLVVIVLLNSLEPQLSWHSFPLDDAWIHRVYAASLASGEGFSYNLKPETGFTSPLWVIVTAPIHWLPESWVVPGVM